MNEVRKFGSAFSNFVRSLLSRKFLMSIALAYVAYESGMEDGVLTTEELTMVAAPILAFLGVEGWADAKRAE